jgi:hypothetical protein
MMKVHETAYASTRTGFDLSDVTSLNQHGPESMRIKTFSFHMRSTPFSAHQYFDIRDKSSLSFEWQTPVATFASDLPQVEVDLQQLPFKKVHRENFPFFSSM